MIALRLTGGGSIWELDDAALATADKHASVALRTVNFQRMIASGVSRVAVVGLLQDILMAGSAVQMKMAEM